MQRHALYRPSGDDSDVAHSTYFPIPNGDRRVNWYQAPPLRFWISPRLRYYINVLSVTLKVLDLCQSSLHLEHDDPVSELLDLPVIVPRNILIITIICIIPKMPTETEKDYGLLPRVATMEEIHNLMHVPDDIPITAWLLAFTGAASQFARFGVTVTWRKCLSL